MRKVLIRRGAGVNSGLPWWFHGYAVDFYCEFCRQLDDLNK
jgi:hypothetical protein